MQKPMDMSDFEWDFEKAIRDAVTARKYEELPQAMDGYVVMVETRLAEPGITVAEVEALEQRMQQLFTWARTMMLINQAEYQQELDRLPRLDAYQTY